MPRLRNCITPVTPGAPVTGYALIKLIAPTQDNGYPYPLMDTVSGKYVAFDETVEAHIDPATGCWTSISLPCNNTISPAGSYYEIIEYVNGAVLDAHIVQFDCAHSTYPDPVNVGDVTLTAPPTGPPSLWQPIVQASETPFTAIAGQGITTIAGDNPAGGAGNGHQPTIKVKLAARSILSFAADNGLQLTVADVQDAVQPILPPPTTGNLDGLSDVRILNGAAGDILRRNNAGIYTNVQGTAFFETAGALARHVADPNPHPQYLIGTGAVTATIASRLGPLTVATAGSSAPRHYNDSDRTWTITQLRYAVDTPSLGQPIVVAVRRNGVSPTIDNGTIQAGINVQINPVAITLAPGDYLQVWVTQVGTVNPGADLTVTAKATAV